MVCRRATKIVVVKIDSPMDVFFRDVNTVQAVYIKYGDFVMLGTPSCVTRRIHL